MRASLFIRTFVVFFFYFVSVTWVTVNCQSIGRCGPEESSKFDSLISRVTIIGNANASFPTTIAESSSWCAQVKDSVKFTKDFSKKCLDGIARQVTSLISYGIAKHQKKVCRSIKSRTEAANKLKCLNGNYARLNGHMEKYIDDYQRSIDLPSKSKLPGLCCAFHSFSTAVKQEAGKTCPDDSVKYFLGYIKAFSSDAIELLCSGYTSSSPACLSLQLPKKSHSIPRTQSFLPPLLMSLSSI